MEEQKIQDIPSIKKTLEDIRSLGTLRQATSLLRPVLRLLKLDVDGIDAAFADFDDLQQMAQDLSTIPDRFDDLFAERGWIIYDLMSLDVARAAIDLAVGGDMDGAEASLAAYYDAETVKRQLRALSYVSAFRPRMRLAERALDDYCEARYHACVPVVLALLDGLVNELHGKRRGFFAADADLEAWDSIAGHSKGLNSLAGILRKGRRKTITQTITIPYRNGIMHGMDLGYDNKMVAAKSWAALFATRDWAIRAERGLLEAPPEDPSRTWGDIIDDIRASQEERERLGAWQPRSIVPGIDIPATGDPSGFGTGTPERRLAQYLTYWQARNYGYMARCVSYCPDTHKSELAGRLRARLDGKRLLTFEFTEVSDHSAAVTEIRSNLVHRVAGRQTTELVVYRLVYQDSDGVSAVRGKPGGTWIVLD